MEKVINKTNLKDGGLKFVLSSILVGIIVGIIGSLFVLKLIAEDSAIKNGAWLHSPFVGSTEAGGYIRTVVSIVGFLGMTREESIYFIARADDESNTLSSQCTYTISGFFSDDQARWWSITAYNALTMKLVPNDQKRYSFNGDNVKKNDDGSFTIVLSSKAPEDLQTTNWVPLEANISFDLILRMYNPSQTVLNHTDSIALPKIHKESCS